MVPTVWGQALPLGKLRAPSSKEKVLWPLQALHLSCRLPSVCVSFPSLPSQCRLSPKQLPDTAVPSLLLVITL